MKRFARTCGTVFLGWLLLALSPLMAEAQVRFGIEAGGASRMKVTSYRDLPFRTVVRQEHDFSCGSAALATLLSFHMGKPRSEGQVFTRMYAVGDQAKIRKAGFSLLDMKAYLAEEGYVADGFRMSFDRLAKVDAPSIAMIDTGRYRHFVVIKGVSRTEVLIGDPAAGLKTYARADFEKLWNGVVFYVRDAKTEQVFNSPDEWSPYAPTPWAVASQTAHIEAGLSREAAPLYQIAPIFSLNDIVR